MSAPDLIEPLLGFRAWRPDDDGRLVPWSAGLSGTWVPGENEARCLASPRAHRAPAHRCTCGLYALTEHADARLRPHQDAVGAIVAWGDIEVHRTGFRAQFARIVALGLPDRCGLAHRERLERAAERYGVPLVAIGLLPEMALEHGRPVAFETLPAHAPRARSPRDRCPPLTEDGLVGYAPDEHLRVEIAGGMLRVAPTAPLARDLGPSSTVRLAGAGIALRRGDPLGRLGEPDGGVVLTSPVSGTLTTGSHGVGETEPALASVGASGWICSITPTCWEQEAGDLEWGDAGARTYAACLAHDARGGDPFAFVRARWVSAHAHVSSAGAVLAQLRADSNRPRFASEQEVHDRVGGALRAAIAEPALAPRLTRLDTLVGWRLHQPGADVVLDLRGPVPSVACGTLDPGEDGLLIYSSAQTADEYLAGRLDLPAAWRRREVQANRPLQHVLRAASVLKSLHPGYRAARAASR